MDRLDTDLRTAKSAHGVRGEIKWGKISAANFDCYQEFADVLFRHIGAGSIKYRQMFLDRSYVWQPRHGEPPGSDLTSQFKLYSTVIQASSIPIGLSTLPKNCRATWVATICLFESDITTAQTFFDSRFVIF